MSINKKLQDIVIALHSDHQLMKSKVISFVNRGQMHDTFHESIQIDLRITEILIMLLDLSKDFVQSNDFTSANEAQIIQLIKNKMTQLENREKDILTNAPDQNSLLELFAIRRIQTTLTTALN